MLRIEDLDAERCPRIYADLLEQDLDWLGLAWDEGGSTGGPNGPYYQSECAEIYTASYKKLEERGLVYPCFCSRAQLHAASAPHTSDGNVVYPGTCRGLTAAEIEEKRKKKAPAYRLMVPDEDITFVDGCMGPHTENLLHDCGDFYLRRADGVFAYAVGRGGRTMPAWALPKWCAVQTCFRPRHGSCICTACWACSTGGFAHCPLLLAPDGRRLSKRDGDQSLENPAGKVYRAGDRGQACLRLRPAAGACAPHTGKPDQRLFLGKGAKAGCLPAGGSVLNKKDALSPDDSAFRFL